VAPIWADTWQPASNTTGASTARRHLIRVLRQTIRPQERAHRPTSRAEQSPFPVSEKDERVRRFPGRSA
jgi:hypothetical protein